MLALDGKGCFTYGFAPHFCQGRIRVPSFLWTHQLPSAACVHMLQSIGHRPYMEDRHVTIPTYQAVNEGNRPVEDGVVRTYAAVFDGHNGAQAADIACCQLHRLLAAEPALRDPQAAGRFAQHLPIGEAIKKVFLKVGNSTARVPFGIPV